MANINLQRPIGPFEADPAPTPEKRESWIQSLAEHPACLRALVHPLSSAQLDTSYRDGGWTIRQIVHHLADNQVHGYVRMRRALTKDAPTVATFDQDDWSSLPDACSQPVRPSVDLLNALYRRWTYLLSSLSEEDFARTLTHPDAGSVSLDEALQLYEWHGRHHIAQIRALCEAEGWA